MYFKPKKRLGQNFLIDKNIQRKIVGSCELKPEDTVLEIGAGKGELTKLIAERVNRVYALEIDKDLFKILKDNLRQVLNTRLINQDILKFDLGKYFRDIRQKIKIVGNIPYYISSPIMEHLFKFRDKIDTIFITVQKEFAKRMNAYAGSKDYSALSCFIQYYGEPKILLNIKRTCFFPVPKVDSCLVRLKIRTKQILIPKDEKLLFKVIRTAFNQRRKTLRNSLGNVVSVEKLDNFFKEYNINRDIRPEGLSLNNYVNLVNYLLE
jgi:16S rRNA (adenine1518-N6/adenine1519-N6)-dimethyltransferase